MKLREKWGVESEEEEEEEERVRWRKSQQISKKK